MKKALLGLSALGMLAGCTANSTSNITTSPVKVDMSLNNPPSTLTVTPNEELDWLSKSILEKGADFMKSGISSLALYAFKTACMEMGIDVRDATTKKIDQIIDQLNQITKQLAKGFDDLTKKMQKVEDDQCMRAVLDLITEVKSPIYVEMTKLESIAQKEDDESYDQDTLAKQKQTFVDGLQKNLNFYGLSNQVWHSTEMLAKKFLYPNSVKTSQTLMDLYDNTLGANDLWDYQSYAPRMQFIQQCSFLVNSLALLSKLDAAREMSTYDSEDDPNVDGLKRGISDMCEAVNAVNGMFQKELEKLEAIRERHDDEDCPTMSHLKRTFDSSGFVHVTTDFTVSAYLATVGVDDVVWTDTVDDYYSDGYSHCFKSYVANEDIYKIVLDDYSFYVDNYETEEGYTVKHFLRDMGFRVPESRQADYDKAIGLYRGVDCRTKDRGIFRGWDYYAYFKYYDLDGKEATKDYCRVGQTFWKNYDDAENYLDNLYSKFVAFVDPDNKKLLGTTYWTIAHRDNKDSSDLIGHFYKGNKSNSSNYCYYNVKG